MEEEVAGKNQRSWPPGAGWEGLSEQQVRGKKSSAADVEGLAQAGFRRGGSKGTRARRASLASSSSPHSLLPSWLCRARRSFAEGKKGRRFLPLRLVVAAPGLCWSGSREGMEPKTTSGVSRSRPEGDRLKGASPSSSMTGSLPAWSNCKPSLRPYD